ncbi:MAG: hypothetical protein U0935_11400 [Pirellulales bacterium]
MTMLDPTESIRRQRLDEINAELGSREALEAERLGESDDWINHHSIAVLWSDELD